jgi:hypothetical protein
MAADGGTLIAATAAAVIASMKLGKRNAVNERPDATTAKQIDRAPPRPHLLLSNTSNLPAFLVFGGNAAEVVVH